MKYFLHLNLPILGSTMSKTKIIVCRHFSMLISILIPPNSLLFEIIVLTKSNSMKYSIGCMPSLLYTCHSPINQLLEKTFQCTMKVTCRREQERIEMNGWQSDFMRHLETFYRTLLRTCWYVVWRNLKSNIRKSVLLS